ncbi:MAG: hypothetical protein AAF483_06965 [Planctomycetota bacterium]
MHINQESKHASSRDKHKVFDLLDANRDGTLDPFEALDLLLQLEDEVQVITEEKLKELAQDMERERRAEVGEFFEGMDRNQDGKVEVDEIDEEMQSMAEIFDLNGDGIIELSEAMTVDFADEMLMSNEEIREEVEFLFDVLDQNKDCALVKKEALEEFPWRQIQEADSNEDQRVSKAELRRLLEADNTEAGFEVEGDRAIMTGVITASTPAAVLRLAHAQPAVRTIVMRLVPGSIDDESNLRAARYVRNFGFSTIIEPNGEVASGGTDFFLAGKQRTVESGGRLGIHSWGGPGFQGSDVPKDDPQHELYLEYYREMGIPEAFYWRTLEAAPIDGIHWMTEQELEQFKVRTGSQDSPANTGTEEAAGNTELVPSDCNAAPTQPKTRNSELVKKKTQLGELAPSQIRYTRIHEVNELFPAKYRSVFDRFNQIIAPNGKSIHIFAQPEISDIQLRHVRSVMLHYLQNLPDSQYGSDKAAVANRMADNRAMMMICKGHDGQYREPRIPAQPLYADETIVEGTTAYINNEFEEHRDASLEEILHCVHDNGIGVDVRWAPEGAAPKYQEEIRNATTNAMKTKLWPTEHFEDETEDWINELRAEGSLTQEYLASVIDSYYGLWGPFEDDFGMWGIYAAKTRKDIQKKDPQGYALVERFFHPFLTYDAEIDGSFKGTFSLRFDDSLQYTHKSQYLLNAFLTGDNDSNLVGNNQDNRLGGNSGDNILDGGEGLDIVVYPRAKSNYTIKKLDDGSMIVVGDGRDHLLNIEELIFDGAAKREAKFSEPVPNGLR